MIYFHENYQVRDFFKKAIIYTKPCNIGFTSRSFLHNYILQNYHSRLSNTLCEFSPHHRLLIKLFVILSFLFFRLKYHNFIGLYITRNCQIYISMSVCWESIFGNVSDTSRHFIILNTETTLRICEPDIKLIE